VGLEDSCVHCGFCLEACPTYVVTRSEVHSPRGRITAVKLDVDSQGFDTCMFCRRCELACPSGVEYARIITKVRRATPEKILMNSLLERPRLAWRVLKAGKSLNSGLIQRVRLSLRDPQEPLEYREIESRGDPLSRMSNLFGLQEDRRERPEVPEGQGT